MPWRAGRLCRERGRNANRRERKQDRNRPEQIHCFPIGSSI
jgi:hypothetical protein